MSFHLAIQLHFSDLWVYISQFQLYNSQLEFISQFFNAILRRKKVRIARCKLAITFFFIIIIIYSVVETGFHALKLFFFLVIANIRKIVKKMFHFIILQTCECCLNLEDSETSIV